MPRTVFERRYWERISDRIKRYSAGVMTSWRIGGQVDFIDYWTEVPATKPEKMIFSELVRRQINFKFSWYVGDVPYTQEYERYRPDFILMDYNIIIEVYGLYWHTRPGSEEHDWTRAMKLTMLGYKIYTLTDIEIITNGAAIALNKIPEIATATIHGNTHLVGQRPFDPTASLRARARRWPKVGTTRRRSRRDAIEPISSYEAPGKAPRPVPKEVEPLAEIWGLELKDWFEGELPPRYWWRGRRTARRGRRRPAWQPWRKSWKDPKGSDEWWKDPELIGPT